MHRNIHPKAFPILIKLETARITLFNKHISKQPCHKPHGMNFASASHNLELKINFIDIAHTPPAHFQPAP